MTALTRLSWFNRIGLGLLGAATILLAAQQRWDLAIVLAGVTGYLGYAAYSSMRGTLSDTGRLQSAQPVDERDARLLTESFAIVGQVALLAQVAILVAGLITDRGDLTVEVYRLLALFLVFGLANWFVLRRA